MRTSKRTTPYRPGQFQADPWTGVPNLLIIPARSSPSGRGRVLMPSYCLARRSPVIRSLVTRQVLDLAGGVVEVVADEGLRGSGSHRRARPRRWPPPPGPPDDGMHGPSPTTTGARSRRWPPAPLRRRRHDADDDRQHSRFSSIGQRLYDIAFLVGPVQPAGRRHPGEPVVEQQARLALGQRGHRDRRSGIGGD